MYGEEINMGVELKNRIPGRYILVVISRFPANASLNNDEVGLSNRNAIISAVKKDFEREGAEQLQYLVYDNGKNPGEGARAFGEMRKDGKKCVDFAEITDAAFGKFVENAMGYAITPKELHNIYSNNEVVADEDFKGKAIVMMNLKVEKVAKDGLDQPFIPIKTGDYGMSGVRLYLKKDDPFLRKIGKGSVIDVRGSVTRFVMGDVMVNAVILTDQNNRLVGDGKIEPIGKK